jgi:hypothetical protein
MLTLRCPAAADARVSCKAGRVTDFINQDLAGSVFEDFDLLLARPD